jgi:diadenosine hexaphosphate hydrolase (ATP-forming)
VADPVHSAGGIVVASDGKIAVVRQPDYAVCWSLPKGKQAPGETLEETARRKIKEETGLDDLVFVREYPPYERGRVKLPGEPDTDVPKVLHFFLVTTGQKDLAPTSPSIGEARWVPWDEAVALLTHPKDREFLAGADLALD